MGQKSWLSWQKKVQPYVLANMPFFLFLYPYMSEWTPQSSTNTMINTCSVPLAVVQISLITSSKREQLQLKYIVDLLAHMRQSRQDIH